MYRSVSFIGDLLGEIEVNGDSWMGFALTVRLGERIRFEHGFSTRREAEDRGRAMLNGLDTLLIPSLAA